MNNWEYQLTQLWWQCVNGKRGIGKPPTRLTMHPDTYQQLFATPTYTASLPITITLTIQTTEEVAPGVLAIAPADFDTWAMIRIDR